MTTEPQPEPSKAKPPSPYWWLVMLPIMGIAGSLSADYGPWPMLIGIGCIFALFKKMQPPKKPIK